MTFAAMTTATTTVHNAQLPSKNDKSKDDDDDDDGEIIIWKRIVKLRIEESEALGITSRLLNDFGNETVTGNIDDALAADDDVFTYIAVRQFLFQQLLFYHIGIVINSNALTVVTTGSADDANSRVTTTHERVASWKVLRDIFRTIDETKKKSQSVGNHIDSLMGETGEDEGSQVLPHGTSETATRPDVNGGDTHSSLQNETVDDNGTIRRPLSEMIRVDETNNSKQSEASNGKTIDLHSASTNDVSRKNLKPNKDNKSNQKQAMKKNDKSTTSSKGVAAAKKRKRPPTEPTVVRKPQQHGTNDSSNASAIPIAPAEKITDVTKSNRTGKEDKLKSQQKASSLNIPATNPNKTAVVVGNSSAVEIAEIDRPIQKRVRSTTDGTQQMTNLTSLIPVEPTVLPPPISKKKKIPDMGNPESSSTVPKKNLKRKLTDASSSRAQNNASEEHPLSNRFDTSTTRPFEAVRETAIIRSTELGHDRETSLTQKNNEINESVPIPTEFQNPSVTRLPENGYRPYNHNAYMEHQPNRNGHIAAPPSGSVQFPERSDPVTKSTANQPNHISKASAPSKIGQNTIDFEDEAVKKSRKFLIYGPWRKQGKRWACELCTAEGIVHLARHCNTERHKNLLEKHLRENVTRHEVVENEAGTRSSSAMNDSREFLLSSQDDDSSPITWTCTLCEVHNIRTAHINSHCELEQHKFLLSNKLRARKCDAPITERRESLESKRSSVRFIVEPNATNIWDGVKESKSLTPMTVLFKGDPVNIACTRKPRLENCVVDFDASDIPKQDAELVGMRLQEWEPFWIIRSIVCIGLTHKINSVSPQTDMIQTAMQHSLPGNLQTRYKFGKTKKSNWKDGENALLFRMLPKSWIAGTTNRADCHFWPKGTFLLVNGFPCRIQQRAQNQEPFHKIWKGPCKELACNELFSGISERNYIQICCADDEPFYYVLSYCSFRSPEQIYSNLVDQTSIERITRLSFDSSVEKAKEIASKAISESIDSDDDDDKNDVEETGKFVFSLTCPISRSLMVTPVRGMHCKHFQVCNQIPVLILCVSSVPSD